MLINAQGLVDRLSFVAQGQQRKGAHPECHSSVIVEVLDDGMSQSIVLRSFSNLTHFKAILGRADKKTIRGSVTVKEEMTEDGAVKIGGPFCFDPKKIIGVLKKSKSQVQLTIDFDKKIIVFRTDGTNIREVGMDASSFVDFPENAIMDELKVPEVMATALRRASWVVDKNHHNEALQGVMVKPADEDMPYVSICGTDQMVISVVQDRENTASVSEPGTIPAESVNVIADVLGRSQSPGFLLTKERARAKSGDFEVSCLLLQTEMVKFWAILDNFRALKIRTIRMNRERLQDSLAIASAFEDEYGSILLMISGTKLKIVGFNSQTGRRADSLVDIEVIDGHIHNEAFCLASKYLTNILKNLDSDRIDLRIPDGTPTAVFVNPVESSTSTTEMFLALMMIQPHFQDMVDALKATPTETAEVPSP